MIRSKLQYIAPGVVMAAPSPRVRIVWHHNSGEEHVIACLGFTTLRDAQACYAWLISHVGRYDYRTNAGACKPRKARRVDNCAFEIKWHSPVPEILRRAIEKDLARVSAC